jgi:hypothetical protein
VRGSPLTQITMVHHEDPAACFDADDSATEIEGCHLPWLCRKATNMAVVRLLLTMHLLKLMPRQAGARAMQPQSAAA